MPRLLFLALMFFSLSAAAPLQAADYAALKKAYSDNPTYANAWMLARACLELSYRAADNESRRKLLEEGKTAAAAAVNLGPKSPEGWYYQAATLGIWADLYGMKEGLATLDTVRKILESATSGIAVDPAWDKGAFFVLRGRLYHKAPGWPISVGDLDKAEQDYKKGLSYDPGSRELHLFYAELLVERGRKQEALQVITEGLALPADEKDRKNDMKRIEALKKLLEQAR